MEENNMEESKKGIYFREKIGKYQAQYWNKDLKTTISIGTFNTEQEAIDARAKYIRDVFDGIVDDSLPKTKMLPKGVSEANSKYRANLQFWVGKNKNKMINVYIGVFNTPEEASEQRKQYILSLL